MNTRFRTRTLLAVAVGTLLASSTVSAGFKRFEQQLRGGEPGGQREQSNGQREQARGQPERHRGQPEQARGQPEQARGQPRPSRNHGEARPQTPDRVASRPPQPRDDTMRSGSPGRSAPAPRPDASLPRDAGTDHARNDTRPRFDGKVAGPDPQPGRSWNDGNSWQDRDQGRAGRDAGSDRGRWNDNPVHSPNPVRSPSPVYRPGVVHRPAPRFVTSLPYGHRSYSWNGAAYYHHGSHWYRPYGTRYVMVGAPYGLFVSYLPSYYSSFWYGGVHYYHADSTYYVYEPVRRGYVVSRSPYGEDEDEEEHTSTADEDLYVYPAQGQSEQQQADDRFECHRWAVDETDHDPIDADYDAELRAEYTRALTACLTGRGYSVR